MFPIIKQWNFFTPWQAGSINSLLPTLDSALNLQGDVISASKQSKIFSFKVSGQNYFIKQYSTSLGLGSWFGYSRLRLECRNQQYFHKLGIPSARVVAYSEASLLSKTLKGVLLTQGIENVSDLFAISETTPQKFKDKVWRNTLIQQLAQIMATLHQHRFCHNDFNFRNILIQQPPASEAGIKQQLKIYLIDCPAGKHFIWPLLNYRKIKDLAMLDKLAPKYLSRTQRLSFF